MSFKLNSDQNVFIELTNKVHGGEGWDFGEFLWSPTVSTSGVDKWKDMRAVKAGDLIIHSFKHPPHTHQFIGVSLAKSSYIETSIEPPLPGRWANRGSYYKIPLQLYSPFSHPLYVKDFLDKYRSKLTTLNEKTPFYIKTITQPAQKYLVPISKTLFQFLLEYFYINNIDLFNNVLIRNEDDFNISPNISGGTYNPVKATTSTLRVIRDTQMMRNLKNACNNRCQICGRNIILPNGSNYSEGHHLQKLGSIHQGPDIPENIIILCPNHHTEFDYGSIGIDTNLKIVHIDSHNEYHNKNLAYNRTDIGSAYLTYHMKNIFNNE